MWFLALLHVQLHFQSNVTWSSLTHLIVHDLLQGNIAGLHLVVSGLFMVSIMFWKDDDCSFDKLKF